MRSLDVEEWRTWIESNGYVYREGLELKGADQKILHRAPVPRAPGELPDFVGDLVEIPGYAGQRMVWISEWRIWSAIEYGLRHLGMLTSTPILSLDDPNFHCYLFEQGEWEDVMPLLCVPLLYCWDAYLLVERGEMLTKISHESDVTFSVLRGSNINATHLPRWQSERLGVHPR